ncbi:sensor histidine kinase [Pseudomonas aeruginosa]
MAFRFAARTLLELGRELISSDHVALYELIKNGIDAGSPSISIECSIVIGRDAYSQALEKILDGEEIDDIVSFLHHSVVPSSLVSTRQAFFSELSCLDAYEFESSLRQAYKRHNYIEIADQGHGMSLEELDEIFLTVGTRSRRGENIKGAAYLGDKGVGRLSAMRLGNHLQVISTRNGERSWNLLSIDWGLITHDSDLDLDDLPVALSSGELKDDISAQGTRIVISDLSSDWSWDKFSNLFQGSISRLIDPFTPGKANSLLHVKHNGSRVMIPSIPQKLLESAHAYCKAKLFFEGEEPRLEGDIFYRLRDKGRVINQRGVEIYSLAQSTQKRRGKTGHASNAVVPISPKALRDLGPVEVEVYWYNRRVVEAVDELTESVQGTRDEIRKWSGGPMLYRYGYRILPYGDAEDDWLELDKNAFGQSGFKLNRQQVIGFVKVVAPHTSFSEQTNREGLIETPSTTALRKVLMWLLHSELRELINDADEEELLARREAEHLVTDYRDAELRVYQAIDKFEMVSGKAGLTVSNDIRRKVTDLVRQCTLVANKTESVLDQAAKDREKFVHLAGIGLMTEFIFHELDRVVDHAVLELSRTKKLPSQSVLQSLEDQLKTLQKRISAFDELSGEKRQVKSQFYLSEVVQQCIDNHAAQFDRHNIFLDFSVEEGQKPIKAVKGMVIQIVENLIANSVYWLKQQVKYQKGFAPKISVTVADGGLSILDNGPGVAPERREIIFQPFITSKPVGQGRGLGLYISSELARYHGWDLFLENSIGLSRAGRLNNFILDMKVK